MGGPFQTLSQLEDTVRARYAGIYLSWHRRNRPRDPPPSPIHHIFQLEFEVEYVGLRPRPSLREPAELSSLKESLKATRLDEKSSSSSRQSHQDTVMAASPLSGNCLIPSSFPGGSRIWGRLRRDWGFRFYIRADVGGSFHTYPCAGGPFQSLEEAESAMDRYLHQHRDPKLLMNRGGVSSVEVAIEKALYWPDGTRKKRSRSHMIEQTCNEIRRLLQALVDKHNEDRKLLGEPAYELKDIVHYQQICEKRMWYYHLNFTMTKEDRDSDRGIENLFFAEVKYVQQVKQQELLVSCFCMVKPTDSGHCYGCTNKGNINMKHPSSADQYIAGHLDVGSPSGFYVEWTDSDDDVEAKKRELRRVFTGVDDPDAKNLSMLPPDATLLEV